MSAEAGVIALPEFEERLEALEAAEAVEQRHELMRRNLMLGRRN